MNSKNDRETVLARFKKGPELLAQALAGLQEADLDAPPEKGGWTIRQIVHHLADGDDLWKAGIKAALGNEGAEFTLEWYWSVPQEEWAERWRYAERPLDTSIALLKASRIHVAELMEHVPNSWNRKISVRWPSGEEKDLSAGFVIRMQADHVEHHVTRILALRREGGRGCGR